MSTGNEFYNNELFELVKVEFDSGSASSYTYAAHRALRLMTGDSVLVPVGNEEDIFAGGKAHEATKVCRVTGVTQDMSHLPSDFPIKHVINKITGKVYNRFLQAKQAYMSSQVDSDSDDDLDLDII